jgi:hypothetical protein
MKDFEDDLRSELRLLKLRQQTSEDVLAIVFGQFLAVLGRLGAPWDDVIAQTRRAIESTTRSAPGHVADAETLETAKLFMEEHVEALFDKIERSMQNTKVKPD